MMHCMLFTFCFWTFAFILFHALSIITVLVLLPTFKNFNISSGGDIEDCFEEARCPELSNVERRSANNCRRNGMNPAISAKGTIPTT